MRYLKEFIRFIRHVAQSRSLLLTLSYSDFRQKYMGSYLGVFWAVLRPVLFIGIIWFVFGLGFKSKPTGDDTPFVLWLLCGYIPWSFFSDAVRRSMTAIVGNASLVKKVSFRVSILPLVKISSALFIHLVFVIVLCVICVLYGHYPTVYWLQIPFFVFCTIVLVLGGGWLISSLRVFVKDIGEIVGVILQFGFWLTPIFWSIHIIPEQYHAILKLNPMFFIVDGYRNALINRVWFWETPGLALYFFVVTSLIMVLGAIVFKRLRPHFGDVL